MYVDIKYLNIISHRLQRFKKKGDYLWNFRCPFCGDSKKSQSKARGFVFRKKNDLFYKCHNCGMGTNLSNLVKHIDSKIHNDYILERYKEGTTATGRGAMSRTQNSIYRNLSSTRKVFLVMSNLLEKLEKSILLIGSLKTEEFLMITISIWSISFILGLTT